MSIWCWSERPPSRTWNRDIYFFIFASHKVVDAAGGLRGHEVISPLSCISAFQNSVAWSIECLPSTWRLISIFCKVEGWGFWMAKNILLLSRDKITIPPLLPPISGSLTDIECNSSVVFPDETSVLWELGHPCYSSHVYISSTHPHQ